MGRERGEEQEGMGREEKGGEGEERMGWEGEFGRERE